MWDSHPRQYWGNVKPRTTRFMTSTERAYVGACLDTDGWASIHPYVSKTGKTYPHPVLGLGNDNLEIISALLRVTGTGKVYYMVSKTGKDFWHYVVNARRDVEDILKQIEAYSTKAQRVLAA